MIGTTLFSRSRVATATLSVLMVLVSDGAKATEVPPFVFVSRDVSRGANVDSPGMEPDGGWARLMVREADGSVRALVENTESPPSQPVDFADPAVSYDGEHVVFSAFSKATGHWRIYEVGADGSGLRQVTTDSHSLDLLRYGAARSHLLGFDDMDPCYLPDGRICFVSTRSPGLAPDRRHRTTNLYVVNRDGSDLRRITAERYGADTPSVDPLSGQIVYSRWWRSPSLSAPSEVETAPQEPPPVPPGGYYSNRPPPPPPPPKPDPAMISVPETSFLGLNSWFLASIDPDGTDMQMFSGFHFDRELTQAWKPSFREDGDVYALFLRRTPFFGTTVRMGVRWLERGLVEPVAVGGPQTFAGTNPADAYLYSSVEALPGGGMLVSAATTERPEIVDIYLRSSPEAPLQKLFGYLGRTEVDAVPLISRDLPPLIEDQVESGFSDEAVLSVEEAYSRGSFKFIVENIHANADIDVAMPNAPPIGKDLTIEFFMNPQRTAPHHGDHPLLLARRVIPPSGRVEVELPAGVPLFEVLRTPEGDFASGRDGQVYHVGGMNFGHAGQDARCVGCHVGHSRMEVPADPTFTNLATSADIEAPFPLTAFTEPFRPENLVDRSTAERTGEWTTPDGMSRATIELSWSSPIEAKELRLYGVRPREGTTLEVGQAIATFRNGAAVSDLKTILGPLSPTGTSISLEGMPPFDSLELILDDVTGEYQSRQRVALAEIEVVGRSVGTMAAGPFMRGDADCNLFIQATDALVLLQGLFDGNGSPCCEAAADADGSETVNIVDAVYLLNYMFLDGPPVPEPRFCGIARTVSLTCQETACESGSE